jgi:hypothetical protein
MKSILSLLLDAAIALVMEVVERVTNSREA